MGGGGVRDPVQFVALLEASASEEDLLKEKEFINKIRGLGDCAVSIARYACDLHHPLQSLNEDIEDAKRKINKKKANRRRRRRRRKKKKR